MKKTLSIILSAILAATGMSVATMAWEKGVDYIALEEIDPDNMGDAFGDMYPGSLDWDWAECSSGQLLKGTIIAGYNGSSHCWSNGTDNAAKAFDGDTSTFFDPYEATTNSWYGLILDQPYELTEIRLMPRESWLGRMVGAAIQGSNDGTNWVDIVYVTGVAEAPAGYDYHVFTPTTNADYTAYYTEYGIEQPDMSTYWVGSGSYQYYRYVNLEGVHGDLADIELYGNPAPATEVSADMVNTTVIYVSDLATFYEDVEVTETAAVVTDGSIAGTVIGGGGAYSETAGYACAFDGDAATFYDPKAAGPKCFTGIQISEPYALTEVKIMPRADQFARTEGATIQGSNDGSAWTTLAAYTIDDVLAAESEQTWISKTITDTNGYTMFRYVSDGTQHGDVAEVAFYGAPAAAAAAPVATEEAPAATTTAGAEPTILWDFNSDEAMSDVMSGANAVSYFGDTVDGVECYEFIASGNDPYVSVNISADDAENVAWAKVRAKNPSYATAIELFGATGGRALAGSECTHVELKTEDDTWYTYLIYVPDENVKTVNAYKDPQYAITEPYWAGTVEYIRLDPLWREGDDGSDAGGNMVGGENIYIDYVAFFATKEDALAFRAEDDNYAFPEQGPAAVEAPVEEAPAEEPAPVEEVVEEAPAEEPAEEVVEAPVEEVVEEVEAPAAEEVEEAPQTFDVGVIAAVVALVSAAGYAISKKNR